MKEDIYRNEDVLLMLDQWLREPEPFWDEFYADRQRSIPFFIQAPDENVVRYFEANQVKVGRYSSSAVVRGETRFILPKKGVRLMLLTFQVQH